MAKNLYPPKSILVMLLIRLLIIGQIFMLVSVSTDAFADLMFDNVWFTDAKFSLDGYSDLINHVYLIVYFISVYFIYLLMLFIKLTTNDLDMIYVPIMQYLERLVIKFCNLLQLLELCKTKVILLLRNAIHTKTNHFDLVNAELAASFLPFV